MNSSLAYKTKGIKSLLNERFFLFTDKLIIVMSVIAFYMEVWTHWFSKGGGSIPPIFGVYFVTLYGMLRLIVNPTIFKNITKLGYFWWLFFYLLLLIANYIIVSFGLSHKYGLFTQDIMNSQLTFIGLAFSLLILFINRSNFYFTIYAVCLAVIAGCIINFLDIVDLTPKWNGTKLRAGGYYMNPNGAAMSLSLGFVISIFLLDKKYHLPFFLFFLAAIFITLSRGAIPVVFVIFLALIFNASIRFKGVLYAGVGLFLFLSIGIGALQKSANYELLVQKLIFNEGTQDRIMTMINPTGHKLNTGVRDDIALDHINFYLNSPIVGNGLSSSKYAQKHKTLTNHSSHVLYIHLLNEFGLIGLVILFGLPLSLCIYSRRLYISKVLVLFTIIYLIACLASHNMYDSRSLIFAYSLYAAYNMHTHFSYEKDN